MSNKPTIPTVNNATLTITQGGTTKGTFTANAGTDVTINLDAGGSGGSTDWSDITNKPNFATVATSGSYNDLSNKPDLSHYVEDTDLASVATSGSYNDLSNKPTIPTVPTNVSAFTNDAGYLTQHQSLEGYATENWVQQQGYSTFSGSYNDLTNKPDLSHYVEDTDLASVATSGSYNDLSNKPTIPTVPTNVSAFTNDAGYLTQHQSLAGYATEQWVENKGYSTFSGSYTDLSNKPDLSVYAETSDLATVATTGSYSDLSNTPSLATVATSGDYTDLTNTPNLATVATSGSYSDLSNTPSLATVATSGSYSDLSNKPSIPDDETDLGLTTETWTFTLQDNSTVTKQVVIKPTV